ncbi:MAG: alkaline phosphatase family protein, partial [Acidobacteriota bacterium]
QDYSPSLEDSNLDRDGVAWSDLEQTDIIAAADGGPSEPSPSEPPATDWEAEREDVDCTAPRDARLPERWIVIGWDGADWDFMLPLIRDGQLPNLERLMREGTYGTLASMRPTLSPAIWTTIATGASPADHGILHFYNQRPVLARWWNRLHNFGELHRRMFTNADRQRRAIWNLVSDAGREVLVVGYHNTFPVEDVEGMMVSNYLVQDSVATSMQMDSGSDSGALASALVDPIDALGAVLELQKEVQGEMPEAIQQFASFDGVDLTEFIRDSRRLEVGTDQKPYFLVHAWLFDEVVARIADAFYDEVAPDLAMVHFQAIDWAGHRFLYYHAPELYDAYDWSAETRARLDADIPLYGETVASFYRYLDDWLGRLLAHRDETTGVLVMSDHGFQTNGDPDLTGEHYDAPAGMIVLAGPGVRHDHRLDGATVYDVMPTLAQSLGLPIAEDLDGEVMVDAFCPQALAATPATRVASYGGSEAYAPDISRPADLDRELLEQMRSLGYIQ